MRPISSACEADERHCSVRLAASIAIFAVSTVWPRFTSPSRRRRRLLTHRSLLGHAGGIPGNQLLKNQDWVQAQPRRYSSYRDANAKECKRVSRMRDFAIRRIRGPIGASGHIATGARGQGSSGKRPAQVRPRHGWGIRAPSAARGCGKRGCRGPGTTSTDD